MTTKPISRSLLPFLPYFFPYFISAFLFLSVLFALFAAVPLVLLHLKKGIRATGAALLSNTLILFLITDRVSATTFLIYVGPIALLLPVFLSVRRYSVERTFGIVLSIIGILILGTGLIHWLATGQDPIDTLNAQIKLGMQQLETLKAIPPQTDEERTQRVARMLTELPSISLIFGLMLLWGTLLGLIRWRDPMIHSRLGVGAEFLKSWKAPEYLVWPVLGAGAFLLLGPEGSLSDVALSVFRFLLAIYGLQGLSILAFFFDYWKLHSMVRVVLYSLVILVMTPFLLGLGFFDLWFDFRAKFRQS